MTARRVPAAARCAACHAGAPPAAAEDLSPRARRAHRLVLEQVGPSIEEAVREHCEAES